MIAKELKQTISKSGQSLELFFPEDKRTKTMQVAKYMQVSWLIAVLYNSCSKWHYSFADSASNLLIIT